MLRQAPLMQPPSETPGLDAARARATAVDALVRPLLAVATADGSVRVAAIGLGAYGRRQLTPRTEVELLLLHDGSLDRRQITEAVLQPLWQHELHLEPLFRTPEECGVEVQRSGTAMLGLLDARFVGGDAALARRLEQHTLEPLRRDRLALRQRLLVSVQRRHLGFPSAVDAPAPDVVDGRGGLRDAQLLRWLDARSARGRGG
jgi:[protein-PII] uridylyltransferase